MRNSTLLLSSRLVIAGPVYHQYILIHTHTFSYIPIHSHAYPYILIHTHNILIPTSILYIPIYTIYTPSHIHAWYYTPTHTYTHTYTHTHSKRCPTVQERVTHTQPMSTSRHTHTVVWRCCVGYTQRVWGMHVKGDSRWGCLMPSLLLTLYVNYR